MRNSRLERLGRYVRWRSTQLAPLAGLGSQKNILAAARPAGKSPVSHKGARREENGEIKQWILEANVVLMRINQDSRSLGEGCS